MFNAPEVTNEYNLLNDFLSTSLLDEGGFLSGDNIQGLYSSPTLINTMAANANGSVGQMHSQQQQSQRSGFFQTPVAQSGNESRTVE